MKNNYQTYYYNTSYSNFPNFYQYTFDLPKNENKTAYNYFNNNIVYQAPTKILKTIIIQSPNYNLNNYLQRTPSPSPIKNSLINGINQVKILSKSPEPYIKYYNNNDYYYNSNNNINYNVKNSQINYNMNNIKRINNPCYLLPNLYQEQNYIKAKTPEPNLRKRKKVKRKPLKYKNITKTIVSENIYYNMNSSILKNYNLVNNIQNNKIIDYNNYSNVSNIPLNNYYYQINNYHTNNIINPFNQNNQIKYYYAQNNNNIRMNRFKQSYINQNEPNNNFNSSEFIIIKNIGEGSFGKIYCINWIKNNKLYALKKLELENIEELKEFQSKVKIVKDLVEKTHHYGFVKIYAEKAVTLYNYKILYYIIMELGERDWEKEVEIRLLNQNYYSEYELFQVIFQLVKTLSLMQKNKVSHRDVKPQNVLIMKNGIYKICDFGEARIIEGNGIVVQRVRGSQLFMSPILFYAYNNNISQVMHNTYKSDVFSLGMCILLAACLSGFILCDIREHFDINVISNLIRNKLNNRYSSNFINLIINMLQVDENLRMDFIELELYLINFMKNQ